MGFAKPRAYCRAASAHCWLRSEGHDTNEACNLLTLFCATQAQHVARRDHILKNWALDPYQAATPRRTPFLAVQRAQAMQPLDWVITICGVWKAFLAAVAAYVTVWPV